MKITIDLMVFPAPPRFSISFSELTDIWLPVGINTPCAVFHTEQPSILFAAPQNIWKLEKQRTIETKQIAREKEKEVKIKEQIKIKIKIKSIELWVIDIMLYIIGICACEQNEGGNEI